LGYGVLGGGAGHALRDQSTSTPDNPSTREPGEPVARPDDAGPPQVSADDPIAPDTHVVGGTYAEGDYSPAARRSTFHVDQLVTSPPEELKSGFGEAEGDEGPAAGPSS
jgi:hypothetical protein